MPYLEASLRSLREQTFEAFEVIAVDDGSTDGSLEVLERYCREDGRFSLIRTDGGIGLPASLNRGIEAARGRYIARHDADDIAVSDRLECQLAFMEEEGVFLSGERLGRCAVIDAGGDRVRGPDHAEEPVRLNETLREDCVLLHPSIMFRTDGTRYREKFLSVEDWDLYLRLVDEGREVYAMDEVLVKRRIHPGSVTTRAPERISYFAEKALLFMDQRRETGEDDYDAFDPDPPEQDIGERRYPEKLEEAREKRL